VLGPRPYRDTAPTRTQGFLRADSRDNKRLCWSRQGFVGLSSLQALGSCASASMRAHLADGYILTFYADVRLNDTSAIPMGWRFSRPSGQLARSVARSACAEGAAHQVSEPPTLRHSTTGQARIAVIH
jgi:hypothetical protein